nr:MAG TPA: hypothetical protein [Caudoviricetes sp.]
MNQRKNILSNPHFISDLEKFIALKQKQRVN